MDHNLKEKLSATPKWIRLLYIVLFYILASIVKALVSLIAIFQFLVVLFTDHPNKMLLEFGDSLSTYIAQIFRFLSYNTETKPYPFTTWPKAKEPEHEIHYAHHHKEPEHPQEAAKEETEIEPQPEVHTDITTSEMPAAPVAKKKRGRPAAE